MPSRVTYDKVTLVPSAARTATGNSGALTTDFFQTEHMSVTLDITARSGTTPSMTLSIEKSPDATTWTTIDTFPAQTNTGTVTREIYGGGWSEIRVVWTISGTTPSFTFSVTATTDNRRYDSARRRR
jgi:hypothetical protein